MSPVGREEPLISEFLTTALEKSLPSVGAKLKIQKLSPDSQAISRKQPFILLSGTSAFGQLRSFKTLLVFMYQKKYLVTWLITAKY